MKKLIELNPGDGYEPGSRCRRERVAGRLELLKAFFDGEPFWMVRLRGLKQTDRDLLGLTGNGHWRFQDKESAEAKFVGLSNRPRYALEARNAAARREAARERALVAQKSGKLRSAPPISWKRC